MSRNVPLLISKILRSQSSHRATRLVCHCHGYWFPHRSGGGACDHSPRRDYWRARRDGVPHEEALQLLSVDQLERMVPLRA